MVTLRRWILESSGGLLHIHGSLIEGYRLLRQGLEWEVGDGCDARFWVDVWFKRTIRGGHCTSPSEGSAVQSAPLLVG